jgi:hypothetical protein
VSLVALARRVAERDEAVLREHQTLDVGRAFVRLGCGLGQGEAGHDVGNPTDASSVQRAHALLSVRLIRECQDAVGVRVIDEPVRQEGMEQ